MADIKITDVTSGRVSGNGVFDTMMKAVTAHLKNEFDENRITGAAYSEVYLSSVSATLQQAIAFVLGEQAADKQADLLAAQIENMGKQNELLDEQRNKLLAEIALLQQKKLTEEAQIKDIVDGASVEGVIGKQKGLFEQQTKGFKRDAEQKAAKLLVDTWSVRQSTDGAIAGQAVDGSGTPIPGAPNNGLGDADIGEMITLLKAGIANN